MNLFGPPVTKARADGKMPWSPTVVNINRMRNRRSRRSVMILAAIAVLLCCACSSAFYVFGKQYTAQPAKISRAVAAPTATATATEAAAVMPPIFTIIVVPATPTP